MSRLQANPDLYASARVGFARLGSVRLVINDPDFLLISNLGIINVMAPGPRAWSTKLKMTF